MSTVYEGNVGLSVDNGLHLFVFGVCRPDVGSFFGRDVSFSPVQGEQI